MTAKKCIVKLDNNSSSGSNTDISSVEHPFKKVKNCAKKSLEGKTISYSFQYKKPAEMENSIFFIIQHQMKQKNDNKAAREKQLILAQMEREATERA
eukprot:4063532-Ditylum_brightwellii.AAC.1